MRWPARMGTLEQMKGDQLPTRTLYYITSAASVVAIQADEEYVILGLITPTAALLSWDSGSYTAQTTGAGLKPYVIGESTSANPLVGLFIPFPKGRTVYLVGSTSLRATLVLAQLN